MKRWLATIFMAVILSQLLMFTVYAAEPVAIVKYSLTCNGIEDERAVDFDCYFDSKDQFVQYYAQFQIVNGPADIVERWYDPDGVLIACREYENFSGGALFNYVETQKLSVDQFDVPRVSGWYKVDLSLKDSTIPFVSIPFMYDAHN